MSGFTSPRERRLWVWSGTVVVAILATIGLARQLVGLVPEPLLGAAFAFAGLMVLATIVTQGLRVRPGGVELGVAVGVVACYLLVFVRTTVGAERSHMIEYGVLAVLVYEALSERRRNGRRVQVVALTAIAIAVAVGVIDESLQWVVPGRVFDPRDILFDSLAAVMAVAATAALGWARRRRRTSLRRPGPTRGSGRRAARRTTP